MMEWKKAGIVPQIFLLLPKFGVGMVSLRRQEVVDHGRAHQTWD
jgi:hypothetical protein